LAHCFVGCTWQDIVTALGFVGNGGGATRASTARTSSEDLTIEEFAEAKGLTVDFLSANHVKQQERGLQITYLERDGTPARQQRARTHIAAKQGSRWIKGAGSPIPYGRWRLDEAIELGELLIVEGETDTLTGWAHNVPTLGIPGADMVKVLDAADLRAIERVFIVKEPDQGGATFIAGMARRLVELGWSGDARVLTLPVKDLSDLHIARGEAFAAELEQARATATPLSIGAVEASAAAESSTTAGVSVINWPLYDAADDWTFPPVEFTVEQLLPAAGVVWWGGMPKRYKSLFLLYCCLAIACRREKIAERFTILRRPRILYVAREDGGSRLQERRDDILAPWGLRPPVGAIRFVIRPHLDLLDAAAVQWLRDTCLREQVTFLVLDTWTALSPSADPLGPRDQAALAAVIVRLAEDIAGLVAVVDHSRKNRPEGQVLSSADIFGPPQKWAAAETIVMLGSTEDPRRLEAFLESKDGDGGRFFLAVSPRGSGKEKFIHAGSVEQLAEDQRAIGDANRQAVLQTLLANDAALGVSEVVDALAADGKVLSRDTVQRHLKSLIAGGRVRQTGSGKATKYFGIAVTPQPPSAAKLVCGDE
jgi:AAA domain-containing protein